MANCDVDPAKILNRGAGWGGTNYGFSNNDNQQESNLKQENAIWDIPPRNVDLSAVSLYAPPKVSPNLNNSGAAFG